MQVIWVLHMVLVVHYGIDLCQGDQVIQANCNDNIQLPCTARNKANPDYKYRSIIWYRNSTALIKRMSNRVIFYNKSSPAFLGVEETLALMNVQPYESGYYKCFLAADINYKDNESFVTLSVSECATDSPGYTTPTDSCLLDVTDVPYWWILAGFVFTTIIKVFISFVTVKVCKRPRGSHSKEGRQQHTTKRS